MVTMAGHYVVELLNMPPYQPVYPHPATAYLKGYLEKHRGNVVVLQRDLNTDSLVHFLGYDTVAPMRDLEFYKDFPRFVQAKETISEKTDKATGGRLRIERNSVIYDLREKKEGDKILVYAEDYVSREGLLAACKNKARNLYYDFFNEAVIPRIKENKSRLVGISASDQKQFLTAAILASMIKEEYGDSVKVVLGGNIITRNYDVLSKDDELNRMLFGQCYDFLIHHEGEAALTELVERLMGGEDVKGVPKLIYMQGGKIKENHEFVVEDTDNIPAPNYDGLFAQGNHWTPKPVIPYVLGRDCGHACGFCDIPIGYDGSRAVMEQKTGKKFKVDYRGRESARRVRDLGKAIEDLKILSEKYDTDYFSFCDEELAGDLLEDFVDKLLESGLKIKWEMYGRMEELYLKPDFCEKLSNAGCKFIQFGVESASQKVLDACKKNYEFDIAKEILKSTYDAGIMNHAFLLVGLPEDNLLEASKLIPFLEECGEYITTLKPIYYKVSKWSPNALCSEINLYRGKTAYFSMSGRTKDKECIKLDRAHTPDLDVNINFAPDAGIMSKHESEAFVRVLDLWIKMHHKVNPATSEYMYAQRMFLTRDELEEFGRSAVPDIRVSAGDMGAGKAVYNGIVREIGKRLAQKKMNRDERKEFNELYWELRSQQVPEDFESLMGVLNRVASAVA